MLPIAFASPSTNSATRSLDVVRLGTVEYEDGLDLMERLIGPVASGALPDQLLLLEHPPVVTLGRNAKDLHLLQSPEALARRGIGFFRTGRGGDVTFHGPGQIVGYPILDLNRGRRDARRYVRDLEEVVIRTLADFGTASGRIAGLTGVWVGDLKVCAIGVRISRWITSHGFAFNVATDLSGFDVMVPCGIPEHGVTSLAKLVGHEVDLEAVGSKLALRFGEVFDRDVTMRSVETRSVQVWIWRRSPAGPEVLLLRRAERDGGFWQPVTGIVEKGEQPDAAARREALEETGIGGALRDLDFVRDFAIEPVGATARPRGPRPWLDREFAFEMETTSSSVRLSESEHDEYVWTTFEKAKELLPWKGNQRALARLSLRWGATHRSS